MSSVYVLIGHIYEGSGEDRDMLLSVFKEIPTEDLLCKVINSMEDSWHKEAFSSIDLATVVLNIGCSVISQTDWGDEIGLELREMELL